MAGVTCSKCGDERGKASPALLKGVIAVLALIALAIWLNPSSQQHRDRIKTVVADRDPVAGMLGAGRLTSFAARYHSLGVASYTELNEKTLSFGMLGWVFVLD